jgi:hypothetical protein
MSSSLNSGKQTALIIAVVGIFFAAVVWYKLPKVDDRSASTTPVAMNTPASPEPALPSPSPAINTPERPSMPELTMLGSVVAGGKRLALIAEAQHKPKLYAPGAIILPDVVLETVGDTQATVRVQEQTVTLKLQSNHRDAPEKKQDGTFIDGFEDRDGSYILPQRRLNDGSYELVLPEQPES